MFNNASDHLRSPRAVVARDAKPEIPVEIRISKRSLAAQGKAAQFPTFLRAEPRAPPEVSQIKEEVTDRISWVFDCGGYGESFAMLEEREKGPAAGRGSVGMDQAEFPPCMRG